MARYYNTRPIAIPVQRGTGTQDANDDEESEFDKHREMLLTADAEEGWAAELRRYTGTMQWDVTKNTDLVEWWQVRNCLESFLVTHRHSLEQCNLISYTCTHRPRCSPFSSLICSLRATVFRQQTNCDRPPGMLRFDSFRRTGNHGVCMETRPL